MLLCLNYHGLKSQFIKNKVSSGAFFKRLIVGWMMLMKRIIDHTLLQWKHYRYRKPLLLRGARQVGKTYAVHMLGKTFDDFVEINFEQMPTARSIFEGDLLPERMLQEIFWITGKQVIPGSTLLFFDEIQVVPKALTALRYFYEQLPALHVIAAGSLLDFAIQLVGIPVGRIDSLYMYPMSFLEFLAAMNYQALVHALLTEDFTQQAFSESVHQKLLGLLSNYLAIGGMPEVVSRWRDDLDPFECSKVHQTLLATYRQDFAKYAQQNQVACVKTVFNHIPQQLGQLFKFSLIEGDYSKKEFVHCVELLVTAGVTHQIFQASGQGLPVGAQANLSGYKLMFLDIALSQAALSLDLREWLLAPQQSFVNKGSVIEAFVGQELLAYADDFKKEPLYFWERSIKNSEVEVDYLIQKDSHVVPIEVKSGVGSTLKSMHAFLQAHQKTPYGVWFSMQNYSFYEKVYSYPLYAVSNFVIKDKKATMAALSL